MRPAAPRRHVHLTSAGLLIVVIHPLFDPAPDVVDGVSGLLLDPPDQVLRVALGAVEVIISDFAPRLADAATDSVESAFGLQISQLGPSFATVEIGFTSQR